jgi:hypothetical protein
VGPGVRLPCIESSNCQDLNLSPGLDFHSLRRSYVTHLIEAGMDALFVQDQVGHDNSSTTALHTCVSSDYRVFPVRASTRLRPTGARSGTACRRRWWSSSIASGNSCSSEQDKDLAPICSY